MDIPTVKSLFIVATLIIYSLVISASDQDGSPSSQQNEKSAKNRLIVISTTSNLLQDSFSRFNESIQGNHLKLELLKDNSREISSYQNGISTSDPKGEMKRQFELIQDKLSVFRNEPGLVLMLVEGANTIVNGNEEQILAKFNDFQKSNGTRILFAADVTCWPEPKLTDRYPPLSSDNNETRGHAGQRFLDSRSVIGFAPDLWNFIELSKSFKLKENEQQQLVIEYVNYDFQLYSTHVYLTQEHRDRLRIDLDHRSSLFENLDTNHVPAVGNQANQRTSLMDRVELEFISGDDDAQSSGQVNLKNLLYNTRPLVVHGSGSNAKIELNSLGNYLGKAWTPKGGCRKCNDSMISLASIKDSDLPVVLVGVFIEEPTPFMESFFNTLTELDYPKSRMHLFIHNSIEYHEKHVDKFIVSAGSKYASYELVDWKQLNKTTTDSSSTSGQKQLPASEWQAREYALTKCKQTGCDYFLSLDSTARLELPESLRVLIETNRKIVAPLLSRPGKLWSNFWGAITRDGYYARSADYVELVSGERVGVWNVPLLMNAYLIEGKFLNRLLAETEVRNGLAKTASTEKRKDAISSNAIDDDRQNYINRLAYYDPKYPTVKPALIFARNLRYMNLFQFVTNSRDFGHLVDPTEYNTSLLYPDFYQLTQNKPDWEREYLHENYTDLFDERDEDESSYPNRIRLEEPCRDVYWFPLISDKFADQLVEMMEQFGQWSSGKNHDPRIEGGYESVPTRDIHFRQVGLHDMWLFFLREYIMPIQLKEYIGYEHDPPRTDLAFVVRYHPSEQPSLRPHHDSSTYTLNIALNSPGVDYEGGGCRFVRYNCSVTESRKGWALIHPGRLTHYHEGLPVTNGTRYILVTFIDP